MMKPLLIQVPHTEPTKPHMVVPLCTAVLRQNGYPQTSQRDLNVEFFAALMEPDHLSAVVSQTQAHLSRLDACDQLTEEEQVQYGALARATLSGTSLIDSVQEALSTLRRPDMFYDFEHYRKAISILQKPFDLISSLDYPHQINQFEHHTRLVTGQTLQQILDEACYPKSTSLTTFFDQIIPGIKAQSPDFILLEATFMNQLLPALVLAFALRAQLGDIPIALSGGIPTAALPCVLINEAKVRDKFFDLIDYIATPPFCEVHDGIVTAYTIQKLVQTLDHNGNLHDIPNLVYRRNDGEIIITHKDSNVDFETMPAPTFDDLPLEKYPGPEIVLPIALSQGCYWRKCAFCIRRDRFVQRSVPRIIADLRNLSERYGVRFFRFVNDSNPPVLLQELCQAIIDAKMDIRWSCYSRFDKGLTHKRCELMYKAGCRVVWLGLEAYNQRVMNAIEKGTDCEMIARIVKDAYDAGLSLAITSFSGFPTETEEEASETIDFLAANCDYISKSCHGVFLLQGQSRVFETPEHYGVRRIYREAQYLSDIFPYEVESGMDNKQTIDFYLQNKEKLAHAYRDYPCSILDNAANFFFYTYSGHSLLHTDRWGAKQFTRPMPPQVNKKDVPEFTFDHFLQLSPDVCLATFHYDINLMEEAWAKKRQGFMNVTVSLNPGQDNTPQVVAASGKPLHYVYNTRSKGLYRVGEATTAILNACKESIKPAALLQKANIKQPAASRIVEQLVQKGILVTTCSKNN